MYVLCGMSLYPSLCNSSDCSFVSMDSDFSLICDGIFLPWDVATPEARAAAFAFVSAKATAPSPPPAKKAKTSAVLKRPSASSSPAASTSESSERLLAEDPIKPVDREHGNGSPAKGHGKARSPYKQLPFFPRWDDTTSA